MTATHRRRKSAQGEHGQTMIEVAITMPVVLLLICALIDFSRAAYTATVVQWAAQEGARVGTITLDQSAVTAAARGRMHGLQSDQAVVVMTQPDADTVTVQVSFPFEFATPFISNLRGTGISMQGSASMIVQPALTASGP